jgi:hypothetical protein
MLMYQLNIDKIFSVINVLLQLQEGKTQSDMRLLAIET